MPDTKSVILIDNDYRAYFKSKPYGAEKSHPQIPSYSIAIGATSSSSNLCDFDIIIINIKDFFFDESDPLADYSKYCMKRLKEIQAALRDGKEVVLLVERNDSLLSQLMDLLNINHIPDRPQSAQLVTTDARFKRFVDSYCNFCGTYESDSIVPICTCNEATCGFHFTFGKGKLYVLPVIITAHTTRYYEPLLKELLSAMFVTSGEMTLPDYLLQYSLLGENKLLEEKKSSLNKVVEIDQILAQHALIKSILVLKHDALVDRLILTLNDLGLHTLKNENYEEDFWILENGKNAVIIEVKGTNGNFARRHLNDLDNHRDENRLSPDFPALLIVNTFSDAKSFEEKDMAPEKDTLNRARSQNIMMMRSLDVFNLYALIKDGKAQLIDFIHILKKKECGWVKVTDKIELITGDSV